MTQINPCQPAQYVREKTDATESAVSFNPKA